MPSQGSPPVSVCRVEGWGGRRGRELIASGRDDCFSRGYADAYRHAQTSTCINTRVYSRAITSPRAHTTRTGRFNIPIVYSSGSVNAGLYRRKITSILVNTPPLHARNNERQRGGGSCDATFPSFPPRTDGIFYPRKKAGSFEYLVIQPRLSSPSHLIPPCKFVAKWNARVLRPLSREHVKRTAQHAVSRFFRTYYEVFSPRCNFFFRDESCNIKDGQWHRLILLIKHFFMLLLRWGKF